MARAARYATKEFYCYYHIPHISCELLLPLCYTLPTGPPVNTRCWRSISQGRSAVQHCAQP